MIFEMLVVSTATVLAGGGVRWAHGRRVRRIQQRQAPEAPAPIHKAGSGFVPDEGVRLTRPPQPQPQFEFQEATSLGAPPGSSEHKAGAPIFAPPRPPLERM